MINNDVYFYVLDLQRKSLKSHCFKNVLFYIRVLKNVIKFLYLSKTECSNALLDELHREVKRIVSIINSVTGSFQLERTPNHIKNFIINSSIR